MPTIKGLFFDLDGTLCDTHEANAVAYRQALAEVGYEVGQDDIRAAVTSGQGSHDYLKALAPAISDEQLAQVTRRKSHFYGEAMHLIKFNYELISFLRVMQPGHVTVLVTHAKKANAGLVLEAGGLRDLFDHLVFYDDVAVHKPDPAGYLRALELTGLSPSEAIAFEDSPAGAQAAEAAGLSVIAVSINYAV